jgi:hypothetical protein
MQDDADGIAKSYHLDYFGCLTATVDSQDFVALPGALFKDEGKCLLLAFSVQ